MYGGVTFDLAESLLVESGEKRIKTSAGQSHRSEQKARTVAVEDTEAVGTIITFLKGQIRSKSQKTATALLCTGGNLHFRPPIKP